MKYLIVKCTRLDDDYECDAKREPLYVGENYEKYDKYGYEIYQIKKNGSLTLIRDWEDISKKCISICFWHNDEDEDLGEPYKIIDICDGNRKNVTDEMIEQLIKEYDLDYQVDEIREDIDDFGCFNAYSGDDVIGFGERSDSFYPINW